jgi:hypothetical protein
MDRDQACRDLSEEPTFMGLRAPDHRHRRRRLSCFVLGAIKVASASLPQHALPKVLVLTIPTQVRLSKTLYYRGLEESGTAPNQASFPRGGGLGITSGRCGWHERWGRCGGMRDEALG